MAISLEGGCRVSDMREGAPFEIGTLKLWPMIDREHGAQAISLRVLEFSPGCSQGFRNTSCDEVLYLLGESETDQQASVFIDGWAYAVKPDSGIYLRPLQTLTVHNHGSNPMVMISSRCPEPIGICELAPPLTSPSSAAPRPNKPPIVHLLHKAAIPTADRWYRVLVDNEVGSTQATQFVGSIPPGRAPDHFHKYEEVLFILKGEGRMWAGETNTPIGPGSCVYLPKGQVHCVENIGTDELRLLGVFYPAGSPSVRYDV
jgi:mannose-6-phosphate isomerase-like protein (cupin superfamily)